MWYFTVAAVLAMIVSAIIDSAIIVAFGAIMQ